MEEHFVNMNKFDTFTCVIVLKEGISRADLA